MKATDRFALLKNTAVRIADIRTLEAKSGKCMGH